MQVVKASKLLLKLASIILPPPPETEIEMPNLTNTEIHQENYLTQYRRRLNKKDLILSQKLGDTNITFGIFINMVSKIGIPNEFKKLYMKICLKHLNQIKDLTDQLKELYTEISSESEHKMAPAAFENLPSIIANIGHFLTQGLAYRNIKIDLRDVLTTQVQDVSFKDFLNTKKDAEEICELPKV